MKFTIDEEGMKKLGEDLKAKLQPPFEAFQAEWIGKPEAEVAVALRAHLTEQGLSPNDQAVADMARKIANG